MAWVCIRVAKAQSMMLGKGDRGGEVDGARLGLCRRMRHVCTEEVGVGRTKAVQRIEYK